MRKASKKGILHYLPGGASFDVKPEMVLTAQQLKALDIVKMFMQKYGSTGVQEAINIACFKLLRMVAVYPVEDEFKLETRRGIFCLMSGFCLKAQRPRILQKQYTQI